MEADDPGILDALNQYGGPFKKGVIKALKAIPGITIVAEEYPAGLGEERTAIDIVASVENGGAICFLTIECKRALAPYKKWVFFKETAAESFKLGRLVHKLTTASAGLSRRWTGGLPVFCSDGCEVRKEKNQNKPSFTASPDPIHKAATQATLGYLGFYQERMPMSMPEGGQISHPQIVVLPLIVTSAELLVSPEDGANVDLATGLCRLDQLEAVPWVTYRFPCHPSTADRTVDRRLEHPTSRYISTCIAFNSGSTDMSVDLYKETLFVVRAERLREFVEGPMLAILQQILKSFPKSNP